MKWRAKYPHSLNLPTSWQQLPNGSAYSTLLESYFERWFTRAAGRRLLKVGGLSAEIHCKTECQQVLLTPEIPQNLTALCQQNNIILIEDSLHKLPFADSTIDVCLLANTLNFTQDPHQLLREISRVLSDDGYLLLSLFNPLSKLLFKHYIGHFRYRHFCRWHIIDWLELLGFEVLDSQILPIKHELKWLASQSVIVARKCSIPLSLQPQRVLFEKQEILNPVSAFKETAHKV